MYDEIKNFDPFDDIDENIAEKQQLVRDGVNLYKEIKPQVEKIMNSEDSFYQWEMDKRNELLSEFTYKINELLNKLSE